MSAIDISKLSYEELVAFTRNAQKRLESEHSAHLDAFVESILDKADAAGFSVGVIAMRLQAVADKLKPAARKPRVKLPMKYQNPHDAKAQWSGKGRLPAWAATHVAAGGKLEDLLIQK